MTGLTAVASGSVPRDPGGTAPAAGCGGPRAGCTGTAPNDATGGYEGIGDENGILEASTADSATVAAVTGDTKGDIPTVVVVKTPAPAATVVTKQADEEGWKIAAFGLGSLVVVLLACGGLVLTRARRPEPQHAPEPAPEPEPEPEPEILA
jgi:competence protein ComEC